MLWTHCSVLLNLFCLWLFQLLVYIARQQTRPRPCPYSSLSAVSKGSRGMSPSIYGQPTFTQIHTQSLDRS